MTIGDIRRKYFRQRLAVSLCADLTITSIHNRPLELGECIVCVEDIGGGGLRFMSNLKLPSNPNIMLQFSTRIMDQFIRLTGHIVWRRKIAEAFFEYGVKFTIDESQESYLIMLINDMASALRRSEIVPGCRFCQKSEKNECFKIRP